MVGGTKLEQRHNRQGRSLGKSPRSSTLHQIGCALSFEPVPIGAQNSSLNMKFHWTMPSSVRPFYRAELAACEKARAAGDIRQEWNHLERAHILGQQWPREHCAVHWRMLLFGFRIKSAHEILGQLPRLLLGGVKSFIGTVPLGNTGGADVPALRSMALPSDLHHILHPANPMPS